MNRTYWIGGIGVAVVIAAIVLNNFANRTENELAKVSGDLSDSVAVPIGNDAQAKSSSNDQIVEKATKKHISPQFDVVRVNPRGDAVFAGRGEPGAKITVLDGGSVIGIVTADERGEWVLVPEEPLMTGSRELIVVQQLGDNVPLKSDSIVLLVVPERGKDIAGQIIRQKSQPLALQVPRFGKGPSRVIQSPLLVDEETSLVSGVSVDVVDYDDKDNFALAGRGETNSEVLVYLDNKFVGSASVDVEGRWQLDPEESVAPGLYTLRADQHKGAKIISRVEIPFSRSAVSAELSLGSSVIVQPGNSLWRIARRTFGRGMAYTNIYEANKDQIRDPDLIYPGQIFSLPEGN